MTSGCFEKSDDGVHMHSIMEAPDLLKKFTQISFMSSFVKNLIADSSSLHYKQLIHARFAYSIMDFKNHIISGN